MVYAHEVDEHGLSWILRLREKQFWIDVPFIPMGEYWQVTAYRKDLTNVLPG
jgi:hypothetical protein